MDVVSGARKGLLPDLYSKVAHYRHKVFVERLGWQLQTRDGGELDQFDRPDNVYVIAQDDDRQVIGCARLLPTMRPYLLADVFPQLLNGMEPPRSADVREPRRFSAADLDGPLAALSLISAPAAARDRYLPGVSLAATLSASRVSSIS